MLLAEKLWVFGSEVFKGVSVLHANFQAIKCKLIMQITRLFLSKTSKPSSIVWRVITLDKLKANFGQYFLLIGQVLKLTKGKKLSYH